jgi:hypothetical protein
MQENFLQRTCFVNRSTDAPGRWDRIRATNSLKVWREFQGGLPHFPIMAITQNDLRAPSPGMDPPPGVLLRSRVGPLGRPRAGHRAVSRRAPRPIARGVLEMQHYLLTTQPH